MHSLLNTLRTPLLVRPTGARLFLVVALVVNALLWGFNLIPSAPHEHAMPHLIVSLIVACIVALRYRWTPVVGALACVAQLVEGFIFLDLIVAAIDGGTTLIYATLFFALAVFGLVVCITLPLQGLRVAPGGTVHPREASHWTYPVVLLIVMLLTAVVLQSAVMARTATADTSGAVLVGLPVLMSRNTRFEPSTLHAKAGDTVTFRLVNADATPHFLDIDEFDVHVTMRADESALATFHPLQPGTYTFYCHPHADKGARTGMVGTLIVKS